MPNKLSDFAKNSNNNQKLSDFANSVGKQMLRLADIDVFGGQTEPKNNKNISYQEDNKGSSKQTTPVSTDTPQSPVENETLIPTKDFFFQLIKTTVNSFSYNENYWKDEYVKDVKIGRDYLDGRKKKDIPFNAECVEQVCELFDRVLSGQAKKHSPKQVSFLLNNLFIKFFNSNFDFLVINGDETEDILNKKQKHWSVLIRKMCNNAFNKKYFDNPHLFDNEPENFRKEYYKPEEQKMAKTIPEVVISADTRTDRGGCIFFLDSPYLDINAFINEYKTRTIYKDALEYFPFVDIQLNPSAKDTKNIKAYWREKVENGDFLPILETNNSFKGYDMNSAGTDIVDNKRILLIKGDAVLYNDIRKFFPDVAAILLLPYTYREPASELCRYEEASELLYQNCHEQNRYDAMTYNNVSMDYFIKNNLPNTYVLRWNPNEKEEEYMNNSHFTAYCYGVIDTIISMWQPSFYRSEIMQEMNEHIETTMNLLE